MLSLKKDLFIACAIFVKNQIMIQNILMTFLVVNVLFRLNIKTTESFSCLPKNGIYEGVNYTGSDFYSEIHNISPIRCFHECLLFKGCTFVNYDKMRFICYLFNTDLNETFVEPDVGFAIMHNVSQDTVCTLFPNLGFEYMLASGILTKRLL